MAKLELLLLTVALCWGSLLVVVAGSLLARTSWGGRTGRILRGSGLGAALLGGVGAAAYAAEVAREVSPGCGGTIALLCLPAVISIWLFFRMKARAGEQHPVPEIQGSSAPSGQTEGHRDSNDREAG